MAQLSNFFDFVDANRWSLRGIEARIDSWNASQLQEFVEVVGQLVKTESRVEGSGFKGVFHFEANADLSGGIEWCSSIICRLRKADELARFAALYSDRVYISNPFELYTDLNPSYYEGVGLEAAKRFLCGDLAVLLYLRPLFEADLLYLRVSPSHICYDCINKAIAPDSDIRSTIKVLETGLRAIYSEEPRYFFRKDGSAYLCKVTGPEYLIEHGEITQTYPKAYRLDLKDIAKSLGRGKAKRLSREELKAVGIVEELIHPIISGLLVQNYSAKTHGTSYLTNKRVEIDAINKTGNQQVAGVSTEMVEGFSHSIPSINVVPLERILSLRQQEYDAFLVYRDAFHSALDQSRGLASADIKILVDDIIRPEINKMERTINVSKRLLSQNLKADVLIGAGFVTVGLFAGLLPADTKPLIEALSAGAGGVAALDAVRRLANLNSTDSKVAENPYYFLWKANRTL